MPEEVKAQQSPTIYAESGGTGETSFLLLHGLGATGDVWRDIRDIIDTNKLGRWIIPDMRGHGRSDWAETYGLGEHSADMAELVRDREKIVAIGHSMGGLICLSLATGWFGLNIVGIVSIGTMINWSEKDTARMAALAEKPTRWFDTRDEALERYLKVSGLYGLLPADDPRVASGIVQEGVSFRLAADNATGTIGGPWMSMLLDIVPCPTILAAGEHDPMVTADHYLPYDETAVSIPGVAHNVHIEDPATTWQLVEKLGID